MVSKNPLSAHTYELFDAKNSSSASSKELRAMYKIANIQLSSKHYDRQSKSHVLQLQAPNKISFPKDQKQQLQIQLEYLIIQCYIQTGNHFAIELNLLDANKTKRRVLFSNISNKIEKKPFFVKIPSSTFCKNVWVNLCLDLKSFMNFFQKCPYYKSLQGISVSGNVKIRKIYFSKSALQQGEGFDQAIDHLQQNLPKACCYPAGTKYVTQIINHSKYEENQIGRNSGSIKKQNNNVSLPKIENTLKKQRSVPKTGIIPYKRNISSQNRRFMSNTNSTQIISRLKNQRYESKNRTQVKNNKHLQLPPMPTKKINSNSWKSGKKPINEHSVQSQKVQTKKTRIIKKLDDHKKGECSNLSDSDYLQMSQKFSTNPRLFKNFRQKQQEPQIQQFIEVQDSINYEITQLKELKQIKHCHMKTVIQEPQDQTELNQSQHGILHQQLKNYANQVQRPYTPPLLTQQPTSNKIDEKPASKIVNTIKEKQIQLIYDPILNCYYDFKTNTYYELKQ